MWLQVSTDTAAVIKERDQLAARVKQLEAKSTSNMPSSMALSSESAIEESSLLANARNVTLLRKLAEKQGEIHRLRV